MLSNTIAYIFWFFDKSREKRSMKKKYQGHPPSSGSGVYSLIYRRFCFSFFIDHGICQRTINISDFCSIIVSNIIGLAVKRQADYCLCKNYFVVTKWDSLNVIKRFSCASKTTLVSSKYTSQSSMLLIVL